MAPQIREKITVRLTCDVRYLRYLPKGYEANRTQRWPLVLFLHGSGERGAELKQLTRHGLPKLIARGRDYPFVVISPQCDAGEDWNAAVLERLIESVVQRYRIDQSRIYLTGLSMGGFGVWALAQRDPARYAAVIPICGGGEPEDAGVLRDLPVWAFHGAKDRVVPPQRTREMIQAIQAAGGAPRVTVYPGVAHDSWTLTYANPKIYEWLLSHQRKRPTGRGRRAA